MSFLNLCQQYYNSTDLYEILEIPKNATEKQVKTAYRKLSLKVHPDRAKEDDRLEATEKFKVLSRIHQILSDKEKRARYDETNCVDDDDESLLCNDWLQYWRMLFKQITIEDIKAYEKEYTGSEEEKKDLKTAYLAGKGDMNYIVDQVQFITNEDEPRIKGILTEMIENKEIPAYKIFTHEPTRKRNRRHAKQLREAKEAEEMKQNMGLNSDKSLELMIQQNKQNRAQKLDSFIDDLANKYGGKTRTSKRKAAATTSEKETRNKRKK
ncbi:J domain-containing protein CG6693 [Epargyreus clarus]|uniref:J domain-containing protein CG6693 n=1 Tax=Epargyreus clarus TaxID=520877 RepID=UPI003C2E7CF4